VLSSGDAQYDFIWRSGGVDTTLVTFVHHFDFDPTVFTAAAVDADADGIAAPSVAGDQLVWRWSVIAGDPDGGSAGGVIIPNGDGTSSGGRFPRITLPALGP
jgi:hypothetical protein